MSAPTSSVAICNLAMELLRVDANITSITTPTTDEEATCGRWYDMVRRSLLRQYVWNFAKKRVVLTPASGSPAFKYEDLYDLPNDYVRLVCLGDEADPKTDYEIENGQILISNDAGNLNTVYIFDQTTVTKFDALFVDLLSFELAKKLSYKFGGQTKNINFIKDECKGLHLAAGAIDGQERPPRKIQRSNFINAHRNRGSHTIASPYTVFP